MNKDRRQLIAELSSDMTATGRAGRTADIIFSWLACNFIVAALLIYATGPFRSGSLQQLQHHPQFLIESLAGVVAIIVLGASAFRSGIPAAASRFKHYLPALALLFIWLSFYIVGLWVPALKPSTLGARTWPCYLEVILFGLPSLFLGLYVVGRLWPLSGAWTGLLIGLAAGAAPALIMQYACMYSPMHIITHHLLPGLLLGVVGLFAGRFFLAR